jgi:hypothetical protein
MMPEFKIYIEADSLDDASVMLDDCEFDYRTDTVGGKIHTVREGETFAETEQSVRDGLSACIEMMGQIKVTASHAALILESLRNKIC